MEHIGYGYTYPCIMDLKMGVQQYGDGATEVKIRDHKERCEKSTIKQPWCQALWNAGLQMSFSILKHSRV